MSRENLRTRWTHCLCGQICALRTEMIEFPRMILLAGECPRCATMLGTLHNRRRYQGIMRMVNAERAAARRKGGRP